MTVFNLLIVGVGGQGGLTLSRIMAEAAVLSGLSVRTGETLGMAQRGGSVQSFVRIGEVVRAPIFAKGDADALIGLEALETARAAPFLRAGGTVFVDPVVKEPLTTLAKRKAYPPVEELLNVLSSSGCEVHRIDAKAEAVRLGSPKSANILIMGAFCGYTRLLPTPNVEKAISKVLGSKSKPAIGAFRRGVQILQRPPL